MVDASDDQLMLRAGRGERAAFALLVGRHSARAGAVAARIAGSRSDAEEIVQEAFLRAWLKAPSWQAQDGSGGAQFSTWFYRVVVNLCLDRKRRPVPAPIDAAENVADDGPDGLLSAARSELAQRVAAALALLPDRQRAALTLCHYEGMTNIEAAQVLDVSVGALESLLVRGRKQLREALGDYAPRAGLVGT